MDIKTILELIKSQYSFTAYVTIFSIFIFFAFVIQFVKEVAKRKAAEKYEHLTKALENKYLKDIENLKNQLQTEREEKSLIFKERIALYKSFMGTLDKFNIRGSDFILNDARNLMISYFEVAPNSKEEKEIQIEFNRRASDYSAELTCLQASLHSQLTEILLFSSVNLKEHIEKYKDGIVELIKYTNDVINYIGSEQFKIALFNNQLKMESMYQPYSNKIKEMQIQHDFLIDLIRSELKIPQ
ncbi:hypothetical protein [Enterobacter roggenkampii]|jgi:hypothetical protein|uniref:hypothetical protein n=1 Tax=Enterobacter roggenkampii TaxID=1812935 RepID=UPI0009C39A47|nr:hypothetical protein [Enterobacter roggenkampii]AQT90884.1 hypothetical protein B1H21_21060 [Enterobacter roggenkampii]EKS9202528.1 hypothetical protein [Enterobacter cloacae]EKV5785054.1 hypothetical protein [Enterobacter cloacae]UER62336.1 hypothetical protein LMJ44_02280 [Enterobacter roggenkampii]